jgi:capsular exopolysaccharide synthesis family protein
LIELEECERLKNNILSINSEGTIKTIMLVSSVIGEGCSTVASNLALSLAKHRTLKTVLIDGNFRHPTLHNFFEIENRIGLSDFISRNEKVEGVLKKTKLPNLSVIPSGAANSNPTEYFESKELKDLILKLKGEFNYLIFDSAPIITYPDSLILASQMDGIILVVQAERMRWEAIQKVKEQLELTHANILGVVLNKKKYVIPEFIYKRLK